DLYLCVHFHGFASYRSGRSGRGGFFSRLLVQPRQAPLIRLELLGRGPGWGRVQASAGVAVSVSVRTRPEVCSAKCPEGSGTQQRGTRWLRLAGDRGDASQPVACCSPGRRIADTRRAAARPAEDLIP